MPHPPAQTPIDPFVASFLRTRRKWSVRHKANSVSIYNRWSRFLAERGLELCGATEGDCNDFLDVRQREVSAATAHKDYQFLAWLYEWLCDGGYLPPVVKRGREVDQSGRGPMEGVAALDPGSPHPDRIKRVQPDEYRRLMASFDKRKTRDCRDAAIISLMWHSGPRLFEVAGAELERLDLDKRELQVLGKGAKWRRLPIAEETVLWLDRYLLRRSRDGDEATALFAGSRRANDGDDRGHLTQRGLSEMIERRSVKVGRKLSPHQFRRAATSEMRNNGVQDVDIAVIQGWEPQSAKLMIPRYTKTDTERLAVAAFHRADPTAVTGSRRRRLKAVG